MGRMRSSWRNVLKVFLISLVSFCVLVPTGFAEIYRWVDGDGKVHFSNEQPEVQSEQMNIQVNSLESISISDSEFLKERERKANARASRKVVMYSATWCGYCRAARNYFRQKNIPFEEYDVENSRKGQDYAKIDDAGVPIIFVGKKRMLGFTPKRFQAMYDQASR